MDPAYAYQYGSYTDPATGYTYPYDPQQAYAYDPSYYGYDQTFAQYAQTSEGQAVGDGADASGGPPEAPSGEPGPPAGSPHKDSKPGNDGKPAKPLPPVVQVKLPKHYQEKMQAKKREEEERRRHEAMRKVAEAEERRKAVAEEAAAAAARRAHLPNMIAGDVEEEVQLKDLDPEDQLLAASTPAEVRAAKKAIQAKQKAAAAEAAAAMPQQVPELREREVAPHERKRRTKSRSGNHWKCVINFQAASIHTG